MTPADIDRAVRTAATDGTYPDGGAGRFLSVAAVAALARELGCPAREVERAALAAAICPLRYARNLRAFSLEEQARLLGATAALIGLGGLGGGLLENLVRAGVGTVRGADGDVFDETNLNRQASLRNSRRGRAQGRAGGQAGRGRQSVGHLYRPQRLSGCGRHAGLARRGGRGRGRPGRPQGPAGPGGGGPDPGHSLVTGAVAGYTVIVATVMPGACSPVEMLASGGAGPSAEEVLGCPSPAVMTAAALQACEVVRLLAGRPPALAGKALLLDLETMHADTVAFS